MALSGCDAVCLCPAFPLHFNRVQWRIKMILLNFDCTWIVWGVSIAPPSLHSQVLPIIQSSTDPTKYSVSFVDEPSKARSGVYSLNVFDEAGYAAIRKAQRGNEDISQVNPLFSMPVEFEVRDWFEGVCSPPSPKYKQSRCGSSFKRLLF